MENDNKIENLFKTFGEDEVIVAEDVQLQSNTPNPTESEQNSDSVKETVESKSKLSESIIQEQEEVVVEEKVVETDDYDFFAEAGIQLEEGDEFKITEETDWSEIAERVKNYIEKNKAVEYEDQEIKDFIVFKEAGGTLEEFRVAPKRIDYASVAESLNDENIDQSEQIVRYALGQKELPEDVVETAVNSFKDKGQLVEQAKLILLKEDENNKQQYEKWIGDVNIKNEEYKKTVEKQIKEVRDTVQTGKFGGLLLSKSEISNFNDFVLKVDSKTQTTQAAQKYSNLTIEQQLLLDYIVFNDFDFNKIKLTDKTIVKPTVRRVGNIGGKVPKAKTQDHDDKEFEENLNSILQKYKNN